MLLSFIVAFGFTFHQSLGSVDSPKVNKNDIGTYNRKLNPQTGTRPVLVVLTYFQDHADRSRPDVADYEDLFVDISNWFSLNSFENYEMEPVIEGWYPIDNTEAHYSFGARGYDDRLQEAFWPILDSIGEQPGWDWSQFDSDGDNNLDGVIFLHTGYGAEMGELDCSNNNNNPQNRIQSRAINTGLRDDNVWSSGDLRVDGYVVASAYGEECTTERSIMGVILHEIMHTFEDALPDLYEVDSLVGNGVGAFDIMGYAYGPQNNAMLPGHLSAWSKYELGWIEPQQVWQDGVYRLRPAATSPDALIIRDLYQRFEYLLLENRQQLEYDADLWAGGAMIYHVDGMANLQTARGFPDQEGWPGNGNHYQVAVLPADGNYDLERGINQGDAGDFWTPGMVLGPGQGNTVFPNTDSYQDGTIEETGITITILEPDGDVARVQIEGVWPAEPTPGPTHPPTSPGATPAPAPSEDEEGIPSEDVPESPSEEEVADDVTVAVDDEAADNATEVPAEDDSSANGKGIMWSLGGVVLLVLIEHF